MSCRSTLATVLVGAVVLLQPLLLSGCWDLRELEEYAHVELVGLDKGSEPGWLRVTVLVQRPGARAGGRGGGETRTESVFITATVEGPTFFAANDRLRRETNRAVTYSHTELLVVGEELARQGVAPLVDALTRSRDSRRSLQVAVTDTITAQELLETVRGDIEVSPATYISRLIQAGRRALGETCVCRLHSLLLAYKNLGEEIVLPLVRTVPTPPRAIPPEAAGGGGGAGGGGAKTGGGSTGGQGGAGGEGEAGQVPAPPIERRVEISGLALFKDDKMVTKLDPEQTKGWNLLRGFWQRGIFTVQGPATDFRPLTVELSHASRRVKVRRDGRRVEIRVVLTLRGMIEDLAGPGLVIDPHRLEPIKALVESELEMRVTQVINIAKTEVGGDVFDYQLHARRTFSSWNEWANFDWNQAFRAAEVTVEARVTDLRSGLTFQPPTPRD